MTTIVAIYARHSTDKQAHSTEDQIARCREYCRQKGYAVFRVYRDEAVSGASIINRPGISDLIDAALCGYFDRVITEDLSRISRDQGDMANFYRKLRFLDITLESVSEGPINELHIGFKGTMNALYIADLADKTRRGMIAAVLKGAVPGGRTYGYDLVHQLDDRQELVKGLRRINPEQAGTVRWIFEQYAAGATLQSICDGLNRLGTPAPKGGKWVNTTLIGQAARKTGLLRQTLYKGVVTYNRMTYRKNPETGKHLSFLRPESDWIQVPVPELAIIDEALFDRVQVMIEERSSLYKQRVLLNQALARQPSPPPRKKRRKRKKRKAGPNKRSLYLFSGKLWCAEHDTAISVIQKRKYVCATKPCALRNLHHPVFARAALAALKRLSVDDIKTAVEKQRRERDELKAGIEALEADLESARAAMRNVLDALAARKSTPESAAYLDDQEAEILRIQYEIHQLQKRYDPISEIPDGEAQDVLQLFRTAIAPLYADPDDQPVVKEVYPWFDRFNVKSDDGTVTISIDYNWPKLLAGLRAVKTRPFLSRPAVILPRR